MKFVVVYNYETKNVADYIADKYHNKFDILYLDESNLTDRKAAFFYKSCAGTRKCPFVGEFSDDNIINSAIWGEVSRFDNETIDEFFNKYTIE
jgi:hypothetical protein